MTSMKGWVGEGWLLVGVKAFFFKLGYTHVGCWAGGDGGGGVASGGDGLYVASVGAAAEAVA